VPTLIANTGRIIRYLGRFFAGKSYQRKDARFKLRMKCRGVDLSFNSAEELGLDPFLASPHANSGGSDLEELLNCLDIIPSDSILDIGCGKGGAMITLAGWPFFRIDGIELSPELVNIGQRNLRRLGYSRGTIKLGDAAEFTDYDPYTFLYTFHAFSAPVTIRVLKNIQASLARSPRKLTLIYKNPIDHDLVVGAGFRQTFEFTHAVPHYRIYEANGRIA
jgi:SAM-dependent methyltransferase